MLVISVKICQNTLTQSFCAAFIGLSEFNPRATHIKGRGHNQPVKQFHYKYPNDTDDPLTSPLMPLADFDTAYPALLSDHKHCCRPWWCWYNAKWNAFCLFRWTIRSSIEHMKFQTHPRAVLRSWQSRSTYKVHAHLSAMRMKWLCSWCLQMMSLNKAPNVPVHQPEDSPWKNIYTTTEPVSLIGKVPNSEEHCRTGKEFRRTRLRLTKPNLHGFVCAEK